MSRVVTKRAEARADILDLYDFIGQNSRDAADRFIKAAEETFEFVARMPGIGAPWDDEDPELTDVPGFPVTKFRRYWIYYRPIEDGIEILRVLHGASDVKRLMEAGDDD